MKELSEVLEILESGDDVEIPMDPRYYDRLHARIMMAVEHKAESSGRNAPPPWFEKPANRAVDSWRTTSRKQN